MSKSHDDYPSNEVTSIEEIEKQIIEGAKAQGGNRVGHRLTIDGNRAVIESEFITFGRQFAGAVSKFPDYFPVLDKLQEVSLSAAGSASGLLNSGAGLMVMTEDAVFFPIRGADAPSYKHAVAIGVGSTISKSEEKENKIKYHLISTKMFAEGEVIPGWKQDDEYYFYVPKLDGLSEPDKIAHESTIGNGITFTTNLSLGGASYIIHYAKGNTGLGSFDKGFEIKEIIDEAIVERNGVMIALEKGADGHTRTSDYMLPWLVPSAPNAKIFGVDIQLKQSEQTALEFEVVATKPDAFEIGSIARKDAPIGRPVLKMPFDGSLPSIYSGTKEEAKGTLPEILRKPYFKDVNGRTETADVANAFIKGETQAWFTGQIKALVEGRITSAVFSQKSKELCVGLGEVQRRIKETDAEFREERARKLPEVKAKRAA